MVLILKLIGHVTMLLTLLISIFLAIVGCALPTFFQAWLEGYARMSYSRLQLTNWWWTLEEAADGTLTVSAFFPVVAFSSAGVVFLLNLIFALVEVEHVRQAAPDRVLQDDRERQPNQETRAKPKGPWDSD